MTRKLKHGRFVTPWGRDRNTQKAYSVTGGVSRTVPNQSLSIPEILARFTRGAAVPGKEPIYDDDFVPDVSRMDFVEQDNYRDELQQVIDSEVLAAKQAKEKKAKPAPTPTLEKPPAEKLPENPADLPPEK